MNKGIAKATGEYLLFLNSGDYLVDHQVIEKAIPYLNGDIDFISGHLVMQTDNGRTVKTHPEQLTMSYLMTQNLSHPSTFIHRRTFDTYGYYDEQLTLVGDWKHFFVSLALNGASYQAIPVEITLFDTSGISSNPNNVKITREEKNKVYQNYLPYIYNNPIDTYIFKHFNYKSKRFYALYNIDKSTWKRKIATFLLSLLTRSTNE